jgi:hypothetical protein
MNRGQKLQGQRPVTGMQLYAVEAGLLDPGSGLAVVVDNLFDFRRSQGVHLLAIPLRFFRRAYGHYTNISLAAQVSTVGNLLKDLCPRPMDAFDEIC